MNLSLYLIALDCLFSMTDAMHLLTWVGIMKDRHDNECNAG